MYNNTLPQKCKVNITIFFQKLNILFIYKLSFGKTSSSIKYGLVSIGQNLLIGRGSVLIPPLIMHFKTAIYFFPSWDGLKLSIIPVLKYVLFLLGSYIKIMSPLLHLSKPFSFLYLKCSRNCNKYSLFQQLKCYLN